MVLKHTMGELKEGLSAAYSRRCWSRWCGTLSSHSLRSTAQFNNVRACSTPSLLWRLLGAGEDRHQGRSRLLQSPSLPLQMHQLTRLRTRAAVAAATRLMEEVANGRSGREHGQASATSGLSETSGKPRAGWMPWNCGVWSVESFALPLPIQILPSSI
jgi:hypothetical protein